MSDSNTKTVPLTQKASTMVDYAVVTRDRVLPEQKIYSPRSPKQPANSNNEILEVPHDILSPFIATRKIIHWNYVVLVALILATFFMMVKIAYEPVEPIIIMDEPIRPHIAKAPQALENNTVQSPPSLINSLGKKLLLPSDINETPSISTGLPANDFPTQDAEKSVTKTDIAPIDKTLQEWLEIELAKKKAKQIAKKDLEREMKQSPVETKPQTSQPPQNNVIEPIDNTGQKAPIVVTETKKEAAKDTKEVVTAPAQQKSIWFKFTDSIQQGAEISCSPAQKAMNQCH